MGKAYLLGTRAEADRDIALHRNLGEVDLIQSGLGPVNNWVSLAWQVIFKSISIRLKKSSRRAI